ncbi:MAG: hypothetical protein CMJ49_08255 [Planctomycetaceae bacterium]|nr:hypothetical protein [Planctomycetaceae bacterium]
MTTQVSTPQSICRFGIAQGDITPPVGIYHRMWGAATHDRSVGVHRALTATAMVFGQAGSAPTAATQQMLIAVDHCVLEQDEVDGISAEVARVAGIECEAVVVVCAHTHGAGLMGRDRAELPGGELVPPYLDSMTQTIGALAKRAIDEVQDVTISYATGRCDVAGNRDRFDPESDQWVTGFNPDVVADDTVIVARVTGAAGRTVATIVNYACHPTTLVWDNQLISPDYPGAMREVVRQATDAPCVFIQGASGELGPRDGFVGDAVVADRNGRQLGFAAMSAFESLGAPNTRHEYAGPVVSGATIGTWERVGLSEADRAASAVWRVDRVKVDLKYRDDLPTKADLEAERVTLLAEEQAARDRGDAAAAADWRALVERNTRMLSRLRERPAGDGFRLGIVIWRMGDAIWLSVQGEPYSLLQTALRERFADRPIVVASIADGWGPLYLPPAEIYGKGIYQESIAVLAPGCLEQLIEVLEERIEKLI